MFVKETLPSPPLCKERVGLPGSNPSAGGDRRCYVFLSPPYEGGDKGVVFII